MQVCTNKMNLSDEVDLEDYVGRTDKISAAEITSICQEAGMQVRARVTQQSFLCCHWCLQAVHDMRA
jgi:ATP-dependent 26S proteasome regulatory subunit